MQGAQSAQMGRELLKCCKPFRDSVRKCEEALLSLPDAPVWSLHEELIAEVARSRVSEAEISQPLCTAIQIALIDFLRVLGIQFAVVIGHSSGEIAAAYAAGFLDLRNAMGIAYYRGKVAHMAKGPEGQPGGMLAAAMSLSEASELCTEPWFDGRVTVAASNSPSGVTLSGDMDAIEEIQENLENENIQFKQLRVDTAYHSHHMAQCSERYLECLKNMNIDKQTPKAHGDCTWISSVRPGTSMLWENIDEYGLDGQYWVDNMVQTVMFSEAVEAAAQTHLTGLAIAVEVGPHPALKGPVGQTLKPILSSVLPYTSCLERGKSNVETMSETLGLIWTYLGRSAVDLSAWPKAFGLGSRLKLLKDLPSYPWNHGQIYWHESRISRNYRLGNHGHQPHSLLGRQRDDYPYEKTWRKIYRLDEMTWMRDHTFQDQILFPAACYVTLAIEAAKLFLNGQPVNMVEVRDMKISKPLIIDDRDGVEVLFTIRSKTLPSTVGSGSILTAEFTSHGSSDQNGLDVLCEGSLIVHVGQQSFADMPLSSISKSELVPLSEERFYRAVSEIGIVYEGCFKKLSSLSRSWGHARAKASWDPRDLKLDCTLHPAVLDAGFQVGLASFVSTAEKAMGTTYLPVGIRRVIVDLSHSYYSISEPTSVEIESRMVNQSRSAVEVDIVMESPLSNDKRCCSIQLDGLILKAAGEPGPSDDRNLFIKTVWGMDGAYGLNIARQTNAKMDQVANMADIYERIALFYLRSLTQGLDSKSLAEMKWHHHELVRYINTILTSIRDGDNNMWPKDWLDDSQEVIQKLSDGYPNDVAVAMLTTVGQNLPAVVRGESEMIEHMVADDLLIRLYREDHKFAACNRSIAEIMRQVSHKYPRAKVLEIGAGTGGTTLSVLDAIGGAYSSYTCTDISASFFTTLEHKLTEKHSATVDFKVFNVEKSPATQGLTEGGYDVVVAANVLHATRDLSQSIRNARALLRPGGYLIAIEVTGNMLRETGLMGGLEGWWLGVEDGRRMGPGLNSRQWDEILQQNGFSGIDCISYDHPDLARHSCSAFSTQAVDSRIETMRDPLSSIELIQESPLIIIGGTSLAVSKLVLRSTKTLRRWSSDIRTYNTIEELEPDRIPPGAFVLCLSDLDNAFFVQPVTNERLSKLQEIFGLSKNVLWVTCGRLLDDPYANMMIGIGRALAVELPHVNVNFLDFDTPESWDVDIITGQVLRMAFSMSSESMMDGMLWVPEPEILVKEGNLLVARAVQDDAANELLNVKRRKIDKLLPPQERIEIAYDNASRAMLVRGEKLDILAEHAAVDVELSVAIHVAGEWPCFLCAGKLQTSGEDVIFLSDTQSSSLSIHQQSILKNTDGLECDAGTLVAAASSLIASSFSLLTQPLRGPVLVYGASNSMAAVMLAMTANENLHLLFVTVTTTVVEQQLPGRLFLHPRTSAREVQRLLPRDSATLITLSSDDIEVILPFLPKTCVVRSFSPAYLFGQSPSQIGAALDKAYEASRKLPHMVVESTAPIIINIQDVPETLNNHKARLSVAISYKREMPISVTLQPLEPHNVFSSKKTYFFVGMTGELGQSLCRFIVNGGARYIVLASRNPVENPHWVTELRSSGVDIRIVKMDVTIPLQVQETVAMIRRTMPVIGGVANAALVLESGIFVNSTAESAIKQLKPKVDGLINLDREFLEDNLDFFLAFGSLGTVCGTPGQAMYHAGNMFMSSMIEKRRRRGKAASVVHLGLLVDLGYVARTDRNLGSDIEGTLRAFSLTPLSESDFHHVVLQGIKAGRPDSFSGEVIMGIEPYVESDETTPRPPWVDKAFFSHMIRSSVSSEVVSSVSATSQSIKGLVDELHSAKCTNEAMLVIQNMVCKKLSTMIKIDEGSIDPNGPLADLGLDSLHGIEIRNWLLKEIGIRLPLLRILGREPLSSICTSLGKQYMDNNAKQGNTAESAVKSTRDVDTLNTLESFKPGDQKTTATEIATPIKVHANQAELNGMGTPSTSDDAATPTSASFTSEDLTWECIQTTANVETGNILSDQGFLQLQAGVDVEGILPNFGTSPLPKDYTRTERLSFAQSGIHFLHTFLEDPTSLNVTIKYSVKGSINPDRLSQALEKVLNYHQFGQTSFFADAGSAEIKQHLIERNKPHQLLKVNGNEMYSELVFNVVAAREYALAAGETFRAVLITHEPELHTLVFGFHLIASDALSFSILLRDVNRAYQMLPLQPNPALFLDFARQQQEDLESDKFSESITYWKSQMLPLPSPIPLLPVAHVTHRHSQRGYGSHTVSRDLNSELALSVKTASQLHGATSMQFYLAVFKVLLARLTDVEDICIGVTDSGRDPAGDFSNAVGHFANILPMRFDTKSEQSFESILKNTCNVVLSSFDHAQVPFDVLLEQLGVERSALSTPLFQVAFNYRLGDILQMPLGACTMIMEKYSDVKTAYDLTINVTQTAEKGHLIECIAADSLYSASATEFIMGSFITLVQFLARDQSIPIKDCPLFSTNEAGRTIAIGRGPTIEFPWPSTLSERFSQVVTEYPDSIAIKDSDESLTYRQLSGRVSHYASLLLGANAAPGSRIAVLCEPSVDLYSAMLSILCIGAVYVPLDVNLPVTRRQAILEACKPDLLVYHEGTDRAILEHMDNEHLLKVYLSDSGSLSNTLEDLLFHKTLTEDEDSFILFTSGSTGTPKGIRLGQAGIMNYAASKRELLNLGQVKVLQQTSVGFDMAIAQAVNAFANGGALVIVPSKARGDPSATAQIILDEEIDFTLFTPSEYLLLATYAADTLKQCMSWRHACSGGETITDRLINTLRRLELPSLTLTDCYGPTEISCATTFRSIKIDDDIANITVDRVRSVGKPIPNTHIYILSDADNTTVPQGMPGEICIGGSGVARGYLETGLDQENFVVNPFATPEDHAKGWYTMYKTGDKGLLQPDGSLTFLGRTDGGDTMVKLRGMRIDLAEVAAAVIQAAPNNSLADAVIISRGEPQYLACFVVVANGVHMDQGRLNSVLRDVELPRYMIPSIILQLERMPVTSNGKVDRRTLSSLSLPDERDSRGNTAPVLTVPEGELLIMWLDVLGETAKTADIGPTTDFFTVGGSSLLLVQLQSVIKDRTGVPLSLQELYQATTVRTMAALMHSERVQLTEESINWDEETTVPGHILESAQDFSTSSAPRPNKRHVLLTGSTSFLGGEILRQLIASEDVAKVHCIAVSDGDRHKIPFQTDEKIVIYAGNLHSPTFGLSGAEVRYLQSTLDQIIHAAVQGHCMNNYRSVKQALYVSTQTLVGLLALPRRVPFHFVSAPRVVLLSGQVEGGPVSMAPYYPPTDGSQGVTASKWASERFLENVAHQAGLPVTINRHCALVGERAPADEVMNSVVHFSLLTGKVPYIPATKGFFDFQDVSVVASEIVNQSLALPGPVSFYHQSSNMRVLFDQLAERLQQIHNRMFQTINTSDWLSSAAAAGMENLLFVHLKANMESGVPIVLPYLGI